MMYTGCHALLIPVMTQIRPMTRPEMMLHIAALVFIFFQNIPATSAKNMGAVTHATRMVTSWVSMDCWMAKVGIMVRKPYAKAMRRVKVSFFFSVKLCFSYTGFNSSRKMVQIARS